MTNKPENDDVGYINRPVLVINDVPRWADDYVRELQREIGMLRDELEDAQAASKVDGVDARQWKVRYTLMENSRNYWWTLANPGVELILATGEKK